MLTGTIMLWGVYLTATIAVCMDSDKNYCGQSSSACDGTDEISLGSGMMFDRIAPFYDSVNRVMSIGLDAVWRRQMVHRLINGSSSSDMQVCARQYLDVAAGTGDVALEILRQDPTAVVRLLDPSSAMLRRAQDKAEKMGHSQGHYIIEVGDATIMPHIEDDSFDRISIAFGIRNIPNRIAALKEMRRVLQHGNITAQDNQQNEYPCDEKGGGRLVVMEVMFPRWRMSILAPFSTFFIKRIVPLIGAFISGGTSIREYQHLRDSMLRFPSPEEFLTELQEAGFTSCTDENIFLDIIHLFICEGKQ